MESVYVPGTRQERFGIEQPAIDLYDLSKKIQYHVTAALFMTLTAFQELLTRGSLIRIKPVSWKVLLLISLFTLGAWHCFLSALSGLSVFEFGAMSLLSPVMMAVLAMVFLGEKPSEKYGPPSFWAWQVAG